MPLDPVVLLSLYDEDLALTPEQGQTMGMVRGTFLLLGSSCQAFDQAACRQHAHLSAWVQHMMRARVLSQCQQSSLQGP